MSLKNAFIRQSKELTLPRNVEGHKLFNELLPEIDPNLIKRFTLYDSYHSRETNAKKYVTYVYVTILHVQSIDKYFKLYLVVKVISEVEILGDFTVYDESGRTVLNNPSGNAFESKVELAVDQLIDTYLTDYAGEVEFSFMINQEPPLKEKEFTVNLQ